MKCPICQHESTLSSQGHFDDRFGYPGTFDLLACKGCGHHFLNAHFSGDETVQLYTQYYPRSSFSTDDYKPATYTKDFRSWFNGEERAYSHVLPNSRVLDVGCGFGETLGYHKSRGCEVYGIDADENILRIAERYGFNAKAGVFADKMFDEKFFDFVTMDQVIEHTDKPVQTLQNLYKILKPGGKLILSFPNDRGWGARLFKKAWIHWHTPYHLQFFSKASLKLAAEKSGLKVEEWRTITSSEWLYYQKIHNLCIPSIGVSSHFWSPKKGWASAPEEVKQKRLWLDRWHRKKINHLITRFFDAIGFGDNVLAVLSRPKA